MWFASRVESLAAGNNAGPLSGIRATGSLQFRLVMIGVRAGRGRYNSVMSKETAFHPRLAALTDQWMDLFGYAAPTVVTDTLEEYRAVRTTAGLMDFSMLRKVDVTGKGALDLLNSLLTRDLAKLRSGQIAYGAFCNESGFIH